MKRVIFISLASCLVAFMPAIGWGQAAPQDSSTIVVDDIRFEAEQFRIDSTDTATVEVTLTNLKDTPRELKINVYGTQLVDTARKAHYFSTMTLGRVLIRFEDKRNYLHYLLQPDSPTRLTIMAASIPPGVSAIQLVRLVFEDSTEEGRFLDVYITDTVSVADPSSPSDSSSS